jgi:hypothetical protein
MFTKNFLLQHGFLLAKWEKIGYNNPVKNRYVFNNIIYGKDVSMNYLNKKTIEDIDVQGKKVLVRRWPTV